MATNFISHDIRSRSSAWGELILGRSKPYHSPKQRNRPTWDMMRSINVVTVCDDPRHWKSLAIRSMRGETLAYGQLLEEFSVCLELFFSRVMTDDLALRAVNDTLRSVADKLHTCDTTRPILPWLLAIASYRAEHPSEARLHH